MAKQLERQGLRKLNERNDRPNWHDRHSLLSVLGLD